MTGTLLIRNTNNHEIKNTITATTGSTKRELPVAGLNPSETHQSVSQRKIMG